VLASRDPSAFFARHVLPVFDARCVECHGPDKAKSGLRLDSLAATLEGEGEDAMVVAGDPDNSELLRRVLLPRDDDEAMPPKGDALSPEQIEAIRAWIAAIPAG
jgi:mono/diheme cytochrome c family protein